MEPFDISKQTLIIGLDFGTTWSCVSFASVPAEPEVHRTEIWDHYRRRVLELYCAKGEEGDPFVDTCSTKANSPVRQSLLYCGSKNGKQAFQKQEKTQEIIAQCFRCSWRGTIQLQEEDLGPFYTWLSWNLSQGPRLSGNQDLEHASPFDKSELYRLRSQLHHWLSNKKDWESSLLMQILYGLASTRRNLQFSELASLVAAVCEDWRKDMTANWDTLMATGNRSNQQPANFLLESLTDVLTKTENEDVDFREPKMRRFLLRIKPAELGFSKLMPGDEFLAITSVLTLGQITEEIFLRPWALFRKSKDILVEKCPFWYYAARFWEIHYRNAEKTSVAVTSLMGKALRAALANEAKRNPEAFRYEEHRRILDLSLTYSRKNGFDVLAKKSARMGGEGVKEEILLRNRGQVLGHRGQPEAKGLQIETLSPPDVRLTDVHRHNIAKEEQKPFTQRSVPRHRTGTDLNQLQPVGDYAHNNFPSLVEQKLLDPVAVTTDSKHISTRHCHRSHDDSFYQTGLGNADASLSMTPHSCSRGMISEDGFWERQFADMNIDNSENETEQMYSSTSTLFGDWEEPHCFDHNDLEGWELLRKSALS